MRLPFSIAVRFAAVVVIVALVQSLVPAIQPPVSPYLSALSVLPAADARAATHCADKTCASFGGPCVRSIGTFCAKSGGQCFTRGC